MSKIINILRKTLAAFRDLETAVRIYILLGGLIGVGGVTWKIVPWTRVSKWMITPLTCRIIPINPLSILLGFVFLVLTFFLGYKIEYFKKPYYWIPYKGLNWKAYKRLTGGKGYNDKMPYCLNHRINFNIIENNNVTKLKCELCEPILMPSFEFKDAQETVEKTARAKYEKHLNSTFLKKIAKIKRLVP